MELHIRARSARRDGGKGTDLRQWQRHDAAVRREIAQHGTHQTQPAQARVEARCIGAQAPHHGHTEVVLQIRAHGRSVRHDADAEILQATARTQARGLQQRRRLESACRDDDFASRECLQQTPALAVFHASGAPLCVEENACGDRVRGDLHVFTDAALRAQVAARCGPATPVADIGLKIADAQLLRAVEVFGAWQPDRFTRRDDGIA